MRLQASDITAGYGETDVLDAVCVGVESGEFVALLGPNGCGKSTLLRVLSHVLSARRGAIHLDGREMAHWSPVDIARRIAFVPQQEPAAFDFSVRDVVSMGRHPYHVRFRPDTAGDYAAVVSALADTDITHLADRPVTRLSGGEHRRVLLARAFAQQTPLLLLDEPTAHLDVTHQVEVLTLLVQRSREQGVGVLAALHDLNQAAEFCDRLILMRAGRLVAEGPPSTVLSSDPLRAAYDAEVQVGQNPITGRPMILALQPIRAPGMP